MSEKDTWVNILKALADDTRLRILKRILEGTSGVNDLARELHISQYNVSKHLKVLRSAGIVDYRKKGTLHEYFIAPALAKRVAKNGQVLDLGCCVFHFDRLHINKKKRKHR